MVADEQLSLSHNKEEPTGLAVLMYSSTISLRSSFLLSLSKFITFFFVV